MEIKLANINEIKTLKLVLQNSLEKSIKLKGTKEVYERFLNETKQHLRKNKKYKNIFFFLAYENNKLVGATNGDSKLGVSYHTIAFEKGRGIGAKLLETKLDYFFNKLKFKKIFSVPETQTGLQLILKFGFEKYCGQEKINLGIINWSREIYELRKEDYIVHF